MEQSNDGCYEEIEEEKVAGLVHVHVTEGGKGTHILKY